MLNPFIINAFFYAQRLPSAVLFICLVEGAGVQLRSDEPVRSTLFHAIELCDAVHHEIVLNNGFWCQIPANRSCIQVPWIIFWFISSTYRTNSPSVSVSAPNRAQSAKQQANLLKTIATTGYFLIIKRFRRTVHGIYDQEMQDSMHFQYKLWDYPLRNQTPEFQLQGALLTSA